MKARLTLCVLGFTALFFFNKAQSQQLNTGQNISENKISIGDDQLQFDVTYGSRFMESNFLSHGQEFLELTAVPWTVQIDGRTISPKNFEVKLEKISSKDVATYAEFSGELKEFNWNVVYDVKNPGQITKILTLTPKQDLKLDIVSMWNASTASDPVVSRTDLQDIAVFYRNDSLGIFASLDFPYSKIVNKDDKNQIFYPPFRILKKGKTYTAHSLTLGATHVTGRQRFEFYEGEVAAMDSYVQNRHEPRFDRPMFLASSINNLYTQPKDGVIYYTMHDQPTLRFNTHLVKEELELMKKLGIEYYQVFPGVFDWTPTDPSPEKVTELMDYAQSQGVRMGDYSGTSEVFCPHFNHNLNSLDKPEWLIESEDGTQDSGYCFGAPKFVDFYMNTIVDTAERFNFEMHCLDFLNIQPCHQESHGHPVGEYSIYHQVKGLVKVLEGINSVSPEMMTWSNSGNWVEFLPKIAWKNPNLYLTDPFISFPFQGLNMTRLLDDARRDQMVSLHYSRFIPYRFMTNYQYLFSRNSVVPDLRSYQFGALSTLAVTPNLGLGEVRQWINTQPGEKQEEIIDFYKHWTGFIEKNFDLWKKTFHVGDDPGVGSVEIYSHTKDDHGFIFIVNSSYSDRTVTVPMNEKLGFTEHRSSELTELYPEEYKRLTAQGPFFTLGSELPIKVPAREVLILEVSPAPDRIAEPTLYGFPGSIEQTSKGYLLKTKGMQGESGKVAVLLPEESQPITSANVRMDIPKQPERQTYSTPLELRGRESKDGYLGFLMDIRFRREAVPTELRHWQIQSATLDQGIAKGLYSGFSDLDSTRILFPLLTNVDKLRNVSLSDKVLDSLELGNLANFRGAYIENAYGEMQETWIELKTEEGSKISSTALRSGEKAEEPKEIPPLAHAEGDSWWLQTEFNLPFMYTMGAEPFFDKHTLLVIPLLRQNQVKEIQAWINGKPLKIEEFNYPRNRSLSTFYADLVGTATKGGKNRLVLHLRY